MDFGNRLKKYRQQKKMKQDDLASMLGIDRSTYANYENNVRFPPKEVLFKIIEVLEISVDYLLTGRTLDEHRKEKRASYKIPVIEEFLIKKGYICWDNISSYRYLSLPVYKDASHFESRDYFYYKVTMDLNCFIRANTLILFHAVANNEADDGSFIAALIDNEDVVIGKIEYHGDIMLLSNLNPMRHTLIFKGADMKRVTILAEAVELVCPLQF